MLELNVRNLGLSEKEISLSGFCQRWRITEFALS
jgi:hypothetical protein